MSVETETRSLQIGPHEVWPPVVLAPMAGVTNAVFRGLCRAHGAGLYVSEMIAARGLVERQEKTYSLARFGPDEAPRSIQLYGTNPAVMHDAAKQLVAEHGAQHIDLNFGCPVRKVTRHGGGSALPWRRTLFAQVVAAAVQGAGDVPVTVKLRMGIDDDHLTYLDAGPIAQAQGAAAVALHARTAEQAYSGRADWTSIARLKEAVTEVPVLGNGDIWTAADAVRMVAETGCDGVVVGRGCLGRPWLFGDLSAAFDGRTVNTAPPMAVVAATLRDHARRLAEWHGDHVGVKDIRKHVGWYLQGYPVGPAIRRRLVQADTLDEFEAVLDELDPTIELPADALGLPRGHQHGPRTVTVPEGFWDDRDSPALLGAGADAYTSGG
ncbi:tRNA dihydrouridine synthase DusB [Aquihabitans sp. McL0605]|uniref:tRNA dihydrouridine synthase DusB n=1 Tax=Aquihabitans sp. McL0605 TaxID=3415671 RepID=UPI003CEEC36B